MKLKKEIQAIKELNEQEKQAQAQKAAVAAVQAQVISDQNQGYASYSAVHKTQAKFNLIYKKQKHTKSYTIFYITHENVTVKIKHIPT